MKERTPEELDVLRRNYADFLRIGKLSKEPQLPALRKLIEKAKAERDAEEQRARPRQQLRTPPGSPGHAQCT